MAGNYLEDYLELSHYIESYDHPTDLAMQDKFLNEFWDKHCVRKLTVLGIPFKVHNEKAKDKWEEMDSLVRAKKRLNRRNFK